MLHHGHQGAHRERLAEQIRYERAHPRVRHELLLDQIDNQGPQARSVLHPTGHFGRESSYRQASAGCTADMGCALLLHVQPHRRQLQHLPALHCVGRYAVQGGLAVLAVGRHLRDDLVGRRHQRQGLPRMPQLPPRCAPALAPLAAQPALQAIAGRWFVTVVAVLGYALSQGLILGQQDGHLLAQLRYQGVLLSHQGLEFGDAVVWRHASRLHLYGNSG